MNQKPSDLMLSIIEFFGILIPGAVLTFLHGDFLVDPLCLSMGKLQISRDWVLPFFISIILGYLLHSFSNLLDTPATWYFSNATQKYWEEVREHIELPGGLKRKQKTCFYSAFSFIGIHNPINPIVVVELERHGADYKLFRSLTLLFILEIPLYCLSVSFSPELLAIAFLIACFAAFRFKQLFDWAYALAFDLYL